MAQLIVGAGATGLVAALELALRGERPRIVERRDAPSPLSRAVGILPMSIPLLERLGVADRIGEEAIAIRAAQVFDGARQAFLLPLDVLDQRRFRLFCLPQDRTEAILADRLEALGTTVEYGRTFRGLSQEAGRVSADVDGERENYDGVLGADGAHSAVRQALGLEPEGYDLSSRWSIADIDVDRSTEAMFRIHLLSDGNAVLAVPIGDRRFRVVATVPDALAAMPVDLGITNVRREGDFTIGIRQVATYGVGRVHLAGDAAHTHSPVGGRGMNLGMADGFEWAIRCAEGRLDGYSASRHRAGAEIIAFTERMRKLVLRPDSPGRRLVLRTLAAAVGFGPVARRINRQILLPGYEASLAAARRADGAVRT